MKTCPLCGNELNTESEDDRGGIYWCPTCFGRATEDHGKGSPATIDEVAEEILHRNPSWKRV